MIVLAGDIGGTKTLLALYRVNRCASVHGSLGFEEIRRERYESSAFKGLASMVEQFLSVGRDEVRCATFAIAGPVVNQVCKATNLPWIVSAHEMATLLGTPHVSLINDFQAVAMGIELLDQDSIHTLNVGEYDPHSPRAVIGAGTGLGQALVMPVEGGWQVWPSEGGHTDFAPRNELEIQLLRYLFRKLGKRVSYERILSGLGFERLYEFVVTEGIEPCSPVVDALKGTKEMAAAITKEGLSGVSSACQRVVEMFASIYGAEAGNQALKCLPFGGLYVAGGIAPKILPAIEKDFLLSFLNKGRMSDLLEKVPVHVILNTHVGLLGAALAAYRQGM